MIQLNDGRKAEITMSQKDNEVALLLTTPNEGKVPLISITEEDGKLSLDLWDLNFDDMDEVVNIRDIADVGMLTIKVNGI